MTMRFEPHRCGCGRIESFVSHHASIAASESPPQIDPSLTTLPLGAEYETRWIQIPLQEKKIGNDKDDYNCSLPPSPSPFLPLSISLSSLQK